VTIRSNSVADYGMLTGRLNVIEAAYAQ